MTDVRYETARAEIPRDLLIIREDIQWVFNDGFFPKGYNPDKTTARYARSEFFGPDFVPGPKFDTGLGNYNSRAAFSTARRLLKAIEVRIAYALMLEKIPQPKLSNPEKALQLISSSTARMKLLPASISEQSQSHIVKAYQSTWQCRCVLHKAMSSGSPETSKPSIEVSLCSVCEIRLASEKASGGRCDTCYRYYARNKKERPKSLDKGKKNFFEEAKHYQAKRTLLGMGYGAS